MDETGGLNDGQYLLRRQPKGIAYSIVDENPLTTLGDRLVANPPDKWDGWILKDYRKEIENEIALNDVAAKKADTIEELAVQIGIDPEKLAESIKRYNELCRKGRDDDFFKKPEKLVPIEKPPFYAFFGKSFSEGTSGGIVIDDSFRVLDQED